MYWGIWCSERSSSGPRSQGKYRNNDPGQWHFQREGPLHQWPHPHSGSKDKTLLGLLSQKHQSLVQVVPGCLEIYLRTGMEFLGQSYSAGTSLHKIRFWNREPLVNHGHCQLLTATGSSHTFPQQATASFSFKKKEGLTSSLRVQKPFIWMLARMVISSNAERAHTNPYPVSISPRTWTQEITHILLGFKNHSPSRWGLDTLP